MEDGIMAGYNRDIVATRKLNDNRKAKLGRGGDTEIRKVDGKKSHVNALEAYLIDVDRKGGEEFAKKVGAGTTNPYTGMPEYYEPEEVGYTEYQKMGSNERLKMMADWGIDQTDLKYLDTGMKSASLDLMELGKQKRLSDYTRDTTKEFTELGLGLTMDAATRSQEASARQAGIATAGITAGVAGTREALGSQLSAGQRAIGRSMAQARSGADAAMAQSGFARSGTVSGNLQQQMRGLTQDYGQAQSDYSRGMRGATRQADIQFAGVRADEQTAADAYKGAKEDYKLGMKKAKITHQIERRGAQLDFASKERDIKEGAMDEFYTDMAEYGGESGVVRYGDNEEGMPTRYYQGKMQTYDGNDWIDDPNQ